MSFRKFFASKSPLPPPDSGLTNQNLPSTSNAKDLHPIQTRHPSPHLHPNVSVILPSTGTEQNSSPSSQQISTPSKHAVQSSNSDQNQTPNQNQAYKITSMPSFPSTLRSNPNPAIPQIPQIPNQINLGNPIAEQSCASKTFTVAVTPIRAKTPPSQPSESTLPAHSLSAMASKIIDMEVKLVHLNNLIQRTRPTNAMANEEELEGGKFHTPALKLVDLDNSIIRIEAEMNLLSSMIGLLTYVNEVNLRAGNSFYYSKVYEQRLLSVEFRQNLKEFYECRVDDGYICPVLGFVVPAVACIASHLFKHEWASVVDQVMGFTNINNVRNGLMLFSAVEEAFDNLRLCFYKNERGELVCWVLDPHIMNQNMLHAAIQQQKNQGKDIPDPGDRLVKTYFYSLQDKPLRFQNQNRPFNRVLNFQARQAISNAIARQWITVEDSMKKFVDYYSDGFDWDKKIRPWLDCKLSMD